MEGEEELDELLEAGSLTLLTLSKPIRDFICLAAFCAAFPAALVLFVRFAAASEAPLRLSSASAADVATPDTPSFPPSPAFLPVISSVNALKELARVASLPITVLITLSTGVKTLIRPCPMLAFKESICKLRILHWFAQLSAVLEKSPCAADN